MEIYGFRIYGDRIKIQSDWKVKFSLRLRSYTIAVYGRIWSYTVTLSRIDVDVAGVFLATAIGICDGFFSESSIHK